MLMEEKTKMNPDIKEQMFEYTFCKYRSLDGCKRWLMDIFESNRLYMSSYKEQNDFEEGDYYFSSNNGLEINHILEMLRNGKSEYKICSMSLEKKDRFDKGKLNRLLWGHYANGGNGILIRFKLGKSILSDKNFTLGEIAYGKKFILSEEEKSNVCDDILVKKILLHKYTDWDYENEFRVLSRYSNYCPIEITEVVIGPKSKTKDNGTVEELRETYHNINFITFESAYGNY